MKATVIILDIIALIASVIALIFFIRGIIILITGKCTIRRYIAKGSNARLIGFYLFLTPIIGGVVITILNEAININSDAITDPIITSIVFFISAIITYSMALSKARSAQKKIR